MAKLRLRNRPELEVSGVRAALKDLPLVASQEHLQPPDLHNVYVPSIHQKALSLEASIVVGMRGAGKSFWTAVLASPDHRRHVAGIAGWQDLAVVQARVGFGQGSEGNEFPNANQIHRLLGAKVDPADIWLGVVLRHALQLLNQSGPGDGSVMGAIEWVREHQKRAEATLTRCDRELAESKQSLVVLFDALDRLAEAWDDVRLLSRSILRFCLDCRTRRAIKLKIFIRPDMEQDDAIWNFADSSKLRQGKIDLVWRAGDLYGLVLQHLANAPIYGVHFQEWTSARFGIRWTQSDDVFIPPSGLTHDEDTLSSIIEALAGEWMGKDRKRGYTYTWIPTHLADAKRQASPRSMLTAFRRAAEWSDENTPSYVLPLHYQGIQHGVAEASRTRVDEIVEDYPWVRPALEAVQGMSVPCELRDLVRRWQSLSLKDLRSGEGKLPPRRYVTDPYRRAKPEALADDLVDLAVLYRTEDGRLNMPDIFRVGFGIKRRGGVKPVR